MSVISRFGNWVNNNGYRAYGDLSVLIFALVIYGAWDSIFGHKKLPDAHVAQLLVAISFAAALASIAVNLSKIAKRLPQLDQGYTFAWFWGFLLAIVFALFFTWALPYTVESLLIGGFFIFHILPKVMYLYTRNREGAKWVAQLAYATQGVQIDEETARKEWISLLKDAGVRSVFLPGPISIISIGLALLVIFNA